MVRKPLQRGKLAGVALAAAVAVGCVGCDEPPVPSTITISPASATLRSLGETVQLAAAVEDQNGWT